MKDRSLEGILSFLDWTAEKGLMAKNTVGGRKVAVSGVLGILDPEEKTDVTVVDLESAMERFVHLQGKKYNPSSLNVYKSRVNASLSDFKRYLDDPMAFKSQASKTEKKGSGSKSGSASQTKPRSAPLPREEVQPNSSSPSSVSTPNVFPIPIRENVVVRIQGLPFDLSASEAERIANVVKAMAMS